MTVGRRSEYAAKLRTPFAVLGIRTNGRAVTEVAFLPNSERAQQPADAIAAQAVRELSRWLDDPHFRFTVPLAPEGTPFRRRVWDALCAIPLGESRTYGELARQLYTAPRAIGGACGANPIAVIVPCHRVVGSSGSLGGFMGVSAKGRPEREHRSAQRDGYLLTEGDPLAIKRWLLAHEGHRFGA